MSAAAPPMEADLDLLRGLPESPPLQRRLAVLAGSLAVHLFIFLAGIKLPSLQINKSTPLAQRRHVVLYLPPELMTQRQPNRSKPSKDISLESLLSHESRSVPQPEAQRQANRASAQAPPKPAPRREAVTPAPPPKRPETLAKAQPPTVPKPPAAVVPPPQQPPKQQAKLTAPSGPFQDVDSAKELANPKLRPPSSDMDSAARELARQRAGDPGTPNAEGTRAPGALSEAAAEQAAVELQSDPQGADFRAYLAQVLGIVRSNWRRVIPESVRNGSLRGKTTVEFIINRDGSIPKLVIGDTSGSDALDRAAAAGLSMSNPLPPLPVGYRGMQVRLAFTFSYNVPNVKP